MPAWIAEGDQALAFLGSSVAGAGDLDGQANEGAVRVFLGPSP